MAGFDRIKPPSQRVDERDASRAPDSDVADRQGRAALFSVSGGPAQPPQPEQPVGGSEDGGDTQSEEEIPRDPRLPTGRSFLQIECSHCGVQCPMPLGTAVRRAFPLAVVLPTKSHPVFATCPCGERRTWLKPSVGLPR